MANPKAPSAKSGSRWSPESAAAELSRSEWETLIDEWIFSERDRFILKRRLLDGIRYCQIADEVSVKFIQINERRIYDIVAKGILTIQRHLKPPAVK